MQVLNTFSTQFDEKTRWKPDWTMIIVYMILGLSLCVFGASIWFSSYPKKVFIQRKPELENKASKIQNEIQALELEENALTDVERIRAIIKELGLVEPSYNSIELRDR